MVALASTSEAIIPDVFPPVITSISPNTLRPQGGDIITISGGNFFQPVRVRIGAREAFIASVTTRQIIAVTPPADLGSAQHLAVDVKVTAEAGTANEISSVVPHGADYVLSVLKPSIRAVYPTAGSTLGGTRIALFGEGFQPPVMVTRVPDGAEMQVIKVSYDEIDVIMPTSANGPGLVGFSVFNVSSNTRTTIENAFRYVPPAVINSVTPLRGPLAGGTTVTIDGAAFTPPSVVTVAGVNAKVLDISDSRIRAVTSPATTSRCRDVVGPMTVTNVDSGDSVTGPQFTYVVPHPSIVSIEGDGDTLNATIANADKPVFSLGGKTVAARSTVTNADGTMTFTLPLPSNFAGRTCPFSARLELNNTATGCTASRVVRITPPESESCKTQRGGS